MTNAQKALAVALIATIGIWGCAQGSPGSAERIKALENKVNRLEEDFKAASAARDQYKKKLTAAEEERDDLREQLKTRTAERDHLAGQFDGFRKNLRDLLGQMDAALTKPAKPPVTTVSQPKPNL